MLSLTKSRLAIAACGALLAISSEAFAAKPLYHVKDLGAISFAEGRLAPDGRFAGTFNWHPAIWTGDRWRRLSSHGETRDASDNGVVVGTVKKDRNYRAVAWRPSGKRIDLLPHAYTSYGTASSPDGTLYGPALKAFGATPYVFAWREGVVTTLPPSPYPWTVPQAANDSGELAGSVATFQCETCCPRKPAVFIGGSWTVLDGVSGSCGVARGINASGTVVGSSSGNGEVVPLSTRTVC